MQASIVRIPSPQLVDPTKKNRGIEYYFIASTFLNTALASSPRVLLALPRLLLLPRRDADGKPRLYQHRRPTLSPLSLSGERRTGRGGECRARWTTATGARGGRRRRARRMADVHLAPNPISLHLSSSPWGYRLDFLRSRGRRRRPWTHEIHRRQPWIRRRRPWTRLLHRDDLAEGETPWRTSSPTTLPLHRRGGSRTAAQPRLGVLCS